MLKILWKSTHLFYRNDADRHAAAPWWETTKQSRQVRNSLDIFFLGCASHFMKIAWKSVHPYFDNITNKHESRKRENQPWIQEVNRNIPKMFLFLPCLMSDLCWKFAENLFICLPVMLKKTRISLKTRKKKPTAQGVNRDTTQILQIVPCILPDLS